MFAPAKLPASLTNALVAEIGKIVRSDVFRSKLEPLGESPTVLSGAALVEFQRSELAKWGNAARQSGATIE